MTQNKFWISKCCHTNFEVSLLVFRIVQMCIFPTVDMFSGNSNLGGPLFWNTLAWGGGRPLHDVKAHHSFSFIFSPLWYPAGTNWVPTGYHGKQKSTTCGCFEKQNTHKCIYKYTMKNWAGLCNTIFCMSTTSLWAWSMSQN